MPVWGWVVILVIAVIVVGFQTGDWSGLVLAIPLAILVPIVAKLPAERPVRRRRGDPAGSAPKDEPRRY